MKVAKWGVYTAANNFRCRHWFSKGPRSAPWALLFPSSVLRGNPDRHQFSQHCMYFSVKPVNRPRTIAPIQMGNLARNSLCQS